MTSRFEDAEVARAIATPCDKTVAGASPTFSWRPFHGAAECAEALPRRMVFGGLEARERWAENRARGAHCVPTKGIGRGRAPGSEAARQRARTLTVVCGRDGCSTPRRARKMTMYVGENALSIWMKATVR